jgi:3-methyl-2-oxobutanoate hydroxymethyltransferase
MERVTIVTLRDRKAKGEKVAMLSIHDFFLAQMAEQAGIEIIIVGDSLGMTAQGRRNTLKVSMEEMLYHSALVRTGTDKIFVVGDMPFGSYQVSDAEAVRNACRFIGESGCEAVKCEASQGLMSSIRAIARAEILVMGHIGLNPQKIHEMGGHKIQGRTVKSTQVLLDTARLLQNAGVCSLLLECVTEEATSTIREQLGPETPVYGIGSGRHTDGQLMISYDLLGFYSGFKGRKPKHVREYKPVSDGSKNFGELVVDSLKQYIADVKGEAEMTSPFPNYHEAHHMSPEELEEVKAYLEKEKAEVARFV